MRSASEVFDRVMTITLDTAPATAPQSEPIIPCGPAIYFDGTCSARHDVKVEAVAAGLRITAKQSAGRVLDEWAYADLRRMSSPDGVLRLSRCGETLLARLEIRDPDLTCAIEDRAETLDRGGAGERRLRRKIVALSFAAGVSLVVTAIYGVPELATQLVPFVPTSVERKLARRSIRTSTQRSIRSILAPPSPAAVARAYCRAAPRSTLSSASSRPLQRFRSSFASMSFAAPSLMPWRCRAATFMSMKASSARRGRPTNWPAYWPTRWVMSPPATAPVSSCKPQACRFCSG
jgi:hypothetical protein